MDETIVHQPPDEKRLNPFAFPAETNVRFNLLIFALVMLSIDLLEVLLSAVSDGSISMTDLANIIPEASVSTDPEVYIAETFALLWKALGSGLASLAVFGVIIGLILVTAYVLYRSHPRRLRRSRGLRPFPPDKDAKFTAEVGALAGLAGISPTPAIEVGEKSPPADGQVFGFKGRYTVRLGHRMPLVMRKLPAIFRGTVLHEMAHIVNGDVGRAYFSQSLWSTVLALLVAPTALVYIATFVARLVREAGALLIGSGGNLLRLVTVATPSFIWVAIQIAGLVALFAAIRGSLLRTREVYADWRAALWGARDGLEAIFRENESQGKPSAWARLWRLHPEPHERLRLLKNPRSLFAIPNDLPLLVGALVGAAASGFLLLTLVTSSTILTTQTLIAALLVTGGPALQLLGLLIDALWFLLAILTITGPMFALTYLTAGTLGLQAQRDGVAATAMQERRGLGPYFRLLIPAALYATGLQVGFMLAPVNFFAPVSSLIDFQGEIGSLVFVPPGVLLWLAFTTVLIWLWLCWGRYTARRWMARQTGPKPPTRRRRFLTFTLAIILWLAMIPVLVSQVMVWNALLRLGDTIPSELAIGAIGVGLGLAAIAAAGGWLLVEVTSLGAVTCPACKRKTTHKQAVGRECDHCGTDLAAWIIAQPAEGVN